MNPIDGVWSLATADEMRALDRYTIDSLGVPGEILMESAGRAMLGPVLRLRAHSAHPSAPVLVLCGVGNNGGDGFVLVRHLLAEGIPAKAIRVGDGSKLSPEAARNWERLERMDAARETAGIADAPDSLETGSVVVDALFGTGLSRALEGGWPEWIRAIARAREAGAKVLAVDLPSGLCADTGQVLGAAVVADATVTISAPKPGLALEPGRSHAGEVFVARVGIADPPSERAAAEPAGAAPVQLWNVRAALARWPARPRSGHKGTFGRVLVVGGSAGLFGAVALCARGALRSGAGLVTVAHPEAIEVAGAGVPTEAMTRAVSATAAGSFAPSAEKELLELVDARDAVALGPGLGRAPDLREWLPRLVASIRVPIVIDADGLQAFGGQLSRLRERVGSTVLTPHPGEAATLLGSDAALLNTDRLSAARTLAEQTGAVVLLKGAATVVAEPSGRTLIVPTGGPALGTGGTGDVLTGIVLALLARGLDGFPAAGLAAWWHGATADHYAASAKGRAGFGLLAGELADRLPGVVAEALSRAQLKQGPWQEASHDELLLRFP